MRSPVQALLWQVVARHRWWFALGGVYLVVAAIVPQVLSPQTLALRVNDISPPAVGQYLAAGCAGVLLHWMLVFVAGGGELERSALFKRSLVLPVTSQRLALVPMLAGAAALAAGWCYSVLAVMRPAGLTVPLAWPAAALALFLAVLQVVSWLPLARPWLRIVLAVPLLCLTVAAALLLALSGLGEGLTAGILAAGWLAMLWPAERAVALARRGDTIDWPGWQRLAERVARLRPRARPFRSPDAAQLWLEWRAHGWLLPVAIAALVVMMGGLFLLADREKIELGWRFLHLLLVMPVLIASTLGANLGKQDFSSGYELSPLLAARPISSARWVAAKLWMCAASAAAAWLLVLAATLLLLFRPGFQQSVLQAIETAGPVRSTALALAAVGGLIVLTWVQMASSLWVSLTGRAWVANGFAFVLVIGILSACTLAVAFVLYPDAKQSLVAALPWLIGLLLAVKALVAAVILRELLARGRIRAADALRLIAVWLAALVASWLIGQRLAAELGLAVASGQLLAGLALVIPFSRLAGAILALDWNRHR